jgi:decaprenylphospho-beta-D-erythro-pentofuranosid-2-ulose 2-reductase
VKRMLVLGATSGIAQAVIRRAAERGDQLHLVARDAARLDAVAADAGVRGGSGRVTHRTADLTDASRVSTVLADAQAALGAPPDLVLIAYGLLGNEEAAQRDAALAQRMLEVNFTSIVPWCESLVAMMSASRSGAIGVIGSPAGDRGRKGVALYGAAKAGLDSYLAALRHRLAGHGPRIVTIKPGYVDTPMVSHLRKNLLFVSPERVAGPILNALDRRNGVVYTPAFWRLIMLVVRLLPDAILHRTQL